MPFNTIANGNAIKQLPTSTISHSIMFNINGVL